ncbi:hypothetical protein BGW80DRAFT_1455189 [Lactifluus volemus]|nr:hypothetical protein BGW80DRAFT_1455189 [Lactifluus volemus]
MDTPIWYVTTPGTPQFGLKAPSLSDVIPPYRMASPRTGFPLPGPPAPSAMSGATKPTREPDPQLGETTELVQISVAGVVTEDVANSTLGPRINVYPGSRAGLEFGCRGNLPLYSANHSQAGARLRCIHAANTYHRQRVSIVKLKYLFRTFPISSAEMAKHGVDYFSRMLGDI